MTYACRYKPTSNFSRDLSQPVLHVKSAWTARLNKHFNILEEVSCSKSYYQSSPVCISGKKLKPSIHALEIWGTFVRRSCGYRRVIWSSAKKKIPLEITLRNRYSWTCQETGGVSGNYICMSTKPLCNPSFFNKTSVTKTTGNRSSRSATN